MLSENVSMVALNDMLTQLCCLTCGAPLVRVVVFVVVRVGGFGRRFSLGGCLSLQALSPPVGWFGGILRDLG